MVDSTDRSASRDRVSPVLIARDQAMDLALRRWDAAEHSRGQLLLVAGESGIGKTRLLSELVTRAGIERSPKAGAFPRETDAPGAILLNLADDLHRYGDVETSRKIRERMWSEGEGRGDAARKRRMLLGDLAEILTDMLARSSMLLRLEDLHWADELSLDVLDRVADALPSLPSLVVATFRSDDVIGRPLQPWRARLLQQRLAEEVRLARLDLAETGQLVAAITGAVPPTSFVEALYRSSDGIPLHIEELVATGAHSSVLESVGEAVLARFGQLDEPTREIVAAASVIGRWFDLDLLEQVTSTDSRSVHEAIRLASDYQVVRSDGVDERFGFRHSIVCDVVYSSISASRRASLHASVARAAVVTGIGEAYVSEHFEKAGETALAYAHARAAAVDAVRLSAHRQASTLYLRALRTMPAGVDPHEKADVITSLAIELLIVDENSDAADLFESAIQLFRDQGDELAAARIVPQLIAARHLLGAPLDERVALGVEALSRIEQLDAAAAGLARVGILGALSAAYMLDRRLDAALEYGTLAAAIEDRNVVTDQRIDINITVGTVLLFAGRGDEGWPMLEAAIASANKAELEASAARAFRMGGSSASVLVEYPIATSWLAQGMEFTARTEHWNDHNYLVAHSAHVAWATGDLAGAGQLGARALADGQGITTRITALIVLGYVALSRREDGKARVHLDEARDLAEQLGEVQRLSPALWGLAELAARAGEPRTAVDLCERGLESSERVGDAAYAFPFVVTGVRAKLAMRDLAGAHKWLERCSALLKLRSIPGTMPALQHASGLIALAEGQTGHARTHLELALAAWDESGRFWEGIEAMHDLAACAMRSRRPSDAAHHTAEANARATVAGAAALIYDAPKVAPSKVGPLSARELDVAKLVTSGLTNRQIGESLTISPKTVSTHVEHILAKLGVARRAEIAAWVTASEAAV